MLNLGLIGDLSSLGPYIHKARENEHVHIIGKSSVGLPDKHADKGLQVPEFNRIELIERSDILFISNFSLIPFTLLSEMVKKSKHFFAATYPNLQPSEIIQLAKLAAEAKTKVQILNPFYYRLPIQWLSAIVKRPVYIDVTYFHPDFEKQQIMLQLILMLKDLAAQPAKKTSAISFKSTPDNNLFQNIQLDLGTGSIINLNLGSKNETIQFTLDAYMNGQFINLDLLNNTSTLNMKPVEMAKVPVTDEISAFLYAVQHKKNVATDLEAYSIAIQMASNIHEKLSRYLNS